MDQGGLKVVVDDDRTSNGALVVRLVGEIDPMTAGDMRSAVLGAVGTHQPQVLMLDFAGVTFMDSSGVRVILELLHGQRARDGRLAVANLPKLVLRVLEVSGITDELELISSE